MTALDPKIPVHPIQVPRGPLRGRACLRTEVTLRAYEVYRHLYGEQRELIEGGCRGGLGAGEVVAFLYARSFPQAEWRMRVDEAFRNMRLGD